MYDWKQFIAILRGRQATIGIIGLGYVGLPLALAFCKAGYPVLGFDIDENKVAAVNRSESYIGHISSEELTAYVDSGQLLGSANLSQLGLADAIIICVPTPLTKQREPDLRFVSETARAISKALRPGQLIVLESSTYPGTTEELVRPILEQHGLRCGHDFLLAFSPEREDPGNTQFSTDRIPKVVGADDDTSSDAAIALYSGVVSSVVPVSNTRVAESVKLLENIFRAVNLGLVNELKVVFDAMGIDIWEVIEAAKTKPFGFMPFYPGPGLGGHCIPIDPFYLTWKAREFGISTRLIELSGQINTAMPGYVVDRLVRALNDHFGLSPRGRRILLVGISYKPNVDDIRESPSLAIALLLEKLGAQVDYHDPYVFQISDTREYKQLRGRRSVALEAGDVQTYDAVIIVTDHDKIDYRLLGQNAKLIVDCRNALRSHLGGGNVAAHVVRA